MPFINKVTVRGTTYYLENLTDGSNIVKLPSGISATDYFVTENTLGKFTVSAKDLEEFKEESNKKFDDFTLDISEDINTFQTAITGDINKFKEDVNKLVRYELPVASKDTLGGVKPATKTDNMTYEVGVDSDGKLWVVSDLQESKDYTDSKAYSLEIVDALPSVENAKDRTFYLIPKASGNGYEKYWKITDSHGNATLDEFAGSSTEVVSELPYEGEIDVDYIVYDGNVCLYYKWISGNWCMVAGSVAKVLLSAEDLDNETGNEFTDYYIKN